MRLAEICKSKREAQILSGEWGLIDPINGKQPLIGYIKHIGESRGQNDFMHKAVKYLESFSGGNIAIGSVTEKWLEEFQEYLLKDTKLSKKRSRIIPAQYVTRFARRRGIGLFPAIRR